ncbi:MAG TPA: NUDIX hydrolase [Pseudonocardiaceae bacterium]|nr:NUDIX hydrolase [Pseudonocardiaceae bacterium]
MAERHGGSSGEPDPWPVTVRAAGTVLWRPAGAGGDDIEVALVHRPRRADWSLPKGKFDPGETAAACAVRETWEETGYLPVLGRPLGHVDYAVPGPVPGHKRVTYFTGRAGTGTFTPNHEVDDVRWLRPPDAAELLSYDTDRDVLSRFTAVPADSRTVLLVRHAKAGNRSAWTGPDDERPLSPAGREQADALRALLPLFGPQRVSAADKVRCVETVAGLGVPVVREPTLTESSYQAAPKAAISRLLAIAGEPGVPVICSQGGVIPGVIGELAARSGLDLGRVPCKKGSVWVLSFSADTPLRLLAAHYIPTALPDPVR